jgi:hypothetical protein
VGIDQDRPPFQKTISDILQPVTGAEDELAPGGNRLVDVHQREAAREEHHRKAEIMRAEVPVVGTLICGETGCETREHGSGEKCFLTFASSLVISGNENRRVEFAESSKPAGM